MAEKRPVCVVEKHVLHSTSETGVSCTVPIKQIMCLQRICDSRYFNKHTSPCIFKIKIS